jgi:hypothetical protein
MQENLGNELLMVCAPLGEPHMKPQLLVWAGCEASRTARSRALGAQTMPHQASLGGACMAMLAVHEP